MARNGITDQIEIPYERVCDHCPQNNAGLPKHAETIIALERMKQEAFTSAVSMFEQVCKKTSNVYILSLVIGGP